MKIKSMSLLAGIFALAIATPGIAQACNGENKERSQQSDTSIPTESSVSVEETSLTSGL